MEKKSFLRKNLKHKKAKCPKVRPFLEYFSQSLPKVQERKFTRLTWIFKKSSQLQCLLMSLKNRKKRITVHYLTKTMLMIQWLQNVPRFLASSITTYWRGRLVVFYLLSYLKPTFFSLKWHSKQKPLISRILSLSRGDLCLIHKSFLFCTTNLQGVKIQVTVFP